MTICLAIYLRDELPMIQRTIPTYAHEFEHRIALDTGSTDGTQQFLKDHGFKVEHADWKEDYSWPMNRLLDLCMEAGHDWCVMLDADEAMMPAEVGPLLGSLPSRYEPVVYMPRYNICGDYNHWWKPDEKDLQPRIIRLGQPVRFKKRIHPIPVLAGKTESAMDTGDAGVADQWIYHYGMCKSLPVIWRKLAQYHDIAMNLPEPDVPMDIAIRESSFLVGLYESCPLFTPAHPLQCLNFRTTGFHPTSPS